MLSDYCVIFLVLFHVVEHATSPVVNALMNDCPRPFRSIDQKAFRRSQEILLRSWSLRLRPSSRTRER